MELNCSLVWGVPQKFSYFSLIENTVFENFTICFVTLYVSIFVIRYIMTRKIRNSDILSKNNMRYGFLTDPNILKLPESVNIEFSKIIDSLKLKDGNHFRKVVDDMKITRKTKKYYRDLIYSLKNEGELKYIYSLFTFICQKYVRCLGKDNQMDVLPYHIGLLWHYSAERLGLPEATTYSTVVLNNWTPLVEDPKTIEDISVINTITQTTDEEWFYKIHIAIELMGSSVLKKLMQWDNNTKSVESIANLLNDFHDFLKKSTRLVKKMREKCDPHFFWNEIRIFLAGYDDVSMFPNGLMIEGTQIVIKWAGGSGAQSTLLQMTDSVFGVKHDVKHAGEFLQKMRSYMPPSDRKFLLELEKNGSIESHVKKFNDPALNNLFQICLNDLKKFRQTHLNIVHTYVWDFIKKARESIENGDHQEAAIIMGNNVNSDGGSGSLGKTVGAKNFSVPSEKTNTLIDFLEKFADDVKNIKI